MTFVNITILNYTSKRNSAISKKMANYICDYCNVNFSRRAKSREIASAYHFCSINCVNLASKKDQVLFKKRKINSINKFGTEHHFSNPEVQEKRRKTCINKFGGPAPICSEVVRERINNSIINKFGDHFSRTSEIKEKKKKTCIDKYGVDSYSKTVEFKSSIDWKDLNKKGFETRKKNGISPISKIEKKFYNFLSEHFDDIKPQVSVDKWWIDFYIPTIDVYIQFNGDYWHGLSKTYEELSQSIHPRDKIIAQTKLRDLARQNYFKKNNLNLVVITEYEFKKKEYSLILDRIKTRGQS
jgi:hypothetical protein